MLKFVQGMVTYGRIKKKLSPDEDKRNRLLSATTWQIRLVLYLLTYPHPPCIGTRKNKAPHNIRLKYYETLAHPA